MAGSKPLHARSWALVKKCQIFFSIRCCGCQYITFAILFFSDQICCQLQAEHGPDSQVVLVVAGEGVDINGIEDEIRKQCDSLPRGDFASKALDHSFIVHARDMVEVYIFIKPFVPHI